MRCPVYFQDHIWHVCTANFRHFFIDFDKPWHEKSFICKSAFCRWVVGFCDCPVPSEFIRGGFTPGVQLSLFDEVS